MAKTRERACQFYICEGQCSKGREGTFYGKCQTCDKYNPLPGSKPNRIDMRRKKMEKILKKEKFDY